MITKTFQILFILLISVGVSAQKKTGKKQKVKKVEELAMVDTIAVDDTSFYENNVSNIDTVKVAAGKAYVFLIKADEWNSQSVGDDLEEKELRKNFDKKAFELIVINKYSYLLFDNGQYLDASSTGSTYEAIAFWSGKKGDHIQTQEGRAKATEFVAKQLGVKKESSYAINDRKYRREITELKSKNTFTPKSKEVMDAYLKMLSVPLITSLNEQDILFNRNQEKVKTIKTFVVEKGKKLGYEYIQLNEKGQPISVVHYNSDGSEESQMKFEYQNNVLKQIKKEEKTIPVLYKDGEMILVENIGEADETVVYYLENGTVLQKRYTMMLDENYA